jgi:hypothetical protein
MSVARRGAGVETGPQLDITCEEKLILRKVPLPFAKV